MNASFPFFEIVVSINSLTFIRFHFILQFDLDQGVKRSPTRTSRLGLAPSPPPPQRFSPFTAVDEQAALISPLALIASAAQPLRHSGRVSRLCLAPIPRRLNGSAPSPQQTSKSSQSRP
uniref:Uncharacterized protein n=1 Tax=Kalanchoe fedtschenkoi TaxID=63787 RepID=A0A7N0UUE4_KALFE